MAATLVPASASNGAPPNQKRPNQTLYCSNLPDKLQKDDLKRALYMLFLPYGPILDIVTLKTTKMRGQAHVLFRDVQASTQALRSLQGHEFFGKQMNLSYANTKSDTLAKLDGTYKQPEAAAVVSAQSQASTLQQSIFAGPPAEAPTASAAPGTQGTGATPTPLAPPPSLKPATGMSESASSGQGVKRAREESDEEDEAPMDMDDAAMDESDDD